MERSSCGLTGALAICLGLVSYLPLAAQDWKGNGRIEGLVLDAEEKPVKGAEVRLRWVEVTYAQHLDADETKVTDLGPELLTSDAKGRWTYLGLRPGVWQVRVQHPLHGSSTGNVRVLSSYTMNARGRTVRVILQGGEIDVSERLREGERLLAEGRPAEARSQLEAVLPNLGDAQRSVLLVTIARTWYLEGNVPSALESLREAIELDPENLEARSVQFELLLAQGDPSAALEAAGQFVEEHPSAPGARLQRARAHLALGQPGKAREDLEEILRLQDDGPETKEARRLLAELAEPK